MKNYKNIFSNLISEQKSIFINDLLNTDKNKYPTFFKKLIQLLLLWEDSIPFNFIKSIFSELYKQKKEVFLKRMF